MTPVYLSQLLDLEENDQRTWDMIVSSCFCVPKSEEWFTSTCADHGIEQEHRALKVLGGIKKIASSSEYFKEYILLTAKMSNIADFCEKFGITDDEVRKRENHYQLSASKNSRIQDNIGKISEVFHTYNVGFDGTDRVFNFFTKKVLP